MLTDAWALKNFIRTAGPAISSEMVGIWNKLSDLSEVIWTVTTITFNRRSDKYLDREG